MRRKKRNAGEVIIEVIADLSKEPMAGSKLALLQHTLVKGVTVFIINGDEVLVLDHDTTYNTTAPPTTDRPDSKPQGELYLMHVHCSRI